MPLLGFLSMQLHLGYYLCGFSNYRLEFVISYGLKVSFSTTL